MNIFLETSCDKNQQPKYICNIAATLRREGSHLFPMLGACPLQNTHKKQGSHLLLCMFVTLPQLIIRADYNHDCFSVMFSDYRLDHHNNVKASF